MAHPYYSINVRFDGFAEDGSGTYRLYNFDAPAGDRLRKGEDPAKGLIWPFLARDGDWTKHADETKAKAAAKKLQEYLEKYEAKRSSKKPTQPDDQ